MLHALYSRSEHGSILVRLPNGLQGPYEVPSLSKTFYSPRTLIATLTGNPNHRQTLKKYFRIRKPHQRNLTILDLFGDLERPDIPLETSRTIRRARRELSIEELFGPLLTPPARRRGKPSLTKRSRTRRPPPAQTLPNGLGIDLAKRGGEVRRLLFAGFGSRILRSGYDPEEVLQEVYRGLLARNIGKCPFDARKSSFGHYVHMVSECVLNNYHRKESRRREVEQVGLPGRGADDGQAFKGAKDAALAADHRLPKGTNLSDGFAPEEAAAGNHAVRSLVERIRSEPSADPLAPKLIPMLIEGRSRREMAEALGVSSGRVSSAITSLRAVATTWGEEAGIL